MSIKDGGCIGLLGAEVVSNGLPLADIDVEGPPGFRFGFFTADFRIWSGYMHLYDTW